MGGGSEKWKKQRKMEQNQNAFDDNIYQKYQTLTIKKQKNTHNKSTRTGRERKNRA